MTMPRRKLTPPKSLYANTPMKRYEGERWEGLLRPIDADEVDWALWAACSAGVDAQQLVAAIDSLTERALSVPNPRADFDPGPCPVCGSTDVETDWIYAPPHLECVGDPETDKNPDHWLPGMSRCLSCPGTEIEMTVSRTDRDDG